MKLPRGRASVFVCGNCKALQLGAFLVDLVHEWSTEKWDCVVVAYIGPIINGIDKLMA